MDNESKCGPGTHYDEETNSCILDEKVDEIEVDEKIVDEKIVDEKEEPQIEE